MCAVGCGGRSLGRAGDSGAGFAHLTPIVYYGGKLYITFFFAPGAPLFSGGGRSGSPTLTPPPAPPARALHSSGEALRNRQCFALAVVMLATAPAAAGKALRQFRGQPPAPPPPALSRCGQSGVAPRAPPLAVARELARSRGRSLMQKPLNFLTQILRKKFAKNLRRCPKITNFEDNLKKNHYGNFQPFGF